MSDSADTIVPPIPYELRLGVTGHRNLENPAAVRAAVVAAIDHLAGRLGGGECRTPVNWVVVSSLAKGADRIVVEVVLGRAGAALEVILPFAADEYRKDFTTSDDLKQFNDLLAKGSLAATKDADAPAKDGNEQPKKPPPPANKEQRDLAYRRVGEQVVDASEIMIAIWNGKPAAGVGGTGDAVAYAVGMNRNVIWIDPTAPVPQPRWLRAAGHGETADLTLDHLHLKSQPLPTHRRDLSQGFCRQAAFNCKHNLSAQVLREGIDERSRGLLALADACGLDPRRLEPILQHIVPLYTKATLWAMNCKWWYSLSVVMTYLLAALAVTVAVVQVLFFAEQLWIIAFEIAAMVLSLGGVVLAQVGFWHDRWLYSRYLAEQLRIAMYTLVLPADATGHLQEVPHALPFYGGPDRWLAAIVKRTVKLVTDERDSRPAHDPSDALQFQAIKQFIIDGWLAGQRKHHAKTAHRKHKRHRLGRLAILALFGLTFLAAALHCLHVAHGAVGLAITAAAITLPTWAAAFHGLSRHFESERLAARARQMDHVLSRLISQAAAAATPAELRPVLREAARIMGLETYEWLVQLSFDPVEVVV